MNQIVKTERFSLVPKTLEEALKFSEILAKSTMIPKQYQGRPGDVFVAMEMGSDVGLKPLQALKGIAVINGIASIWGDAALAIVLSHPALEDIEEFYIEETQTCVCKIKRKKLSLREATFSKEDAVKAGLWGKAGTWTQYPKRMLQMRARGFVLRDTFADALKGMILAEEAQDYPMNDVTPTAVPPISNDSKVSKAERLADHIEGARHMVADSDHIADTNDMVDVNKTEKKDWTITFLAKKGIPQSISPLAMELQELIIERDVPKKITDVWLESAGVKTLTELDNDKLTKCINYVQEKFKEAA